MSARPRALRHAPLWLAGCLLATAVAGDGRAQDAPLDRAAIAAAGRGLDGRAAVNQAAGTGNAQANQAALSLSPGGLAVAGARTAQQVGRHEPGAPARGAQARIGAGAFDGAHGLLQLNQSAGAGNAQLNRFALARGAAAAVDDAALAEVAAPPAPAAPSATAQGPRQAAIGEAFRAGRGVLQLNQTAGTGNSSVNALVLRLPGSAP